MYICKNMSIKKIVIFSSFSVFIYYFSVILANTKKNIYNLICDLLYTVHILIDLKYLTINLLLYELSEGCLWCKATMKIKVALLYSF